MKPAILVQCPFHPPGQGDAGLLDPVYNDILRKYYHKKEETTAKKKKTKNEKSRNILSRVSTFLIKLCQIKLIMAFQPPCCC